MPNNRSVLARNFAPVQLRQVDWFRIEIMLILAGAVIRDWYLSIARPDWHPTSEDVAMFALIAGTALSAFGLKKYFEAKIGTTPTPAADSGEGDTSV